MIWDSKLQEEFTTLRLKELAGTILPDEKQRLSNLVEVLENEETTRLAPGIKKMRVEQAILQERLKQTQKRNEELAKLLTQQEQLVTDGRRWLAEFTQRHEYIQNTYTKLTGELLVTP